MGIRGLKAFMEREDVCEEHNLHDTEVIIDGDNFVHHFYRELNINCEYGGDYHAFSRELKRIFEIIRKCKISPYVVFDGGYDPDGRKLNTKKRRLDERIRKVFEIQSGEKNDFSPILTLETSFNTLNEMEIEYHVTSFEADEEIAAIANERKCPVISDDSDFFVYNLTHGFVPLSSLQMCEPVLSQNREYALKCKMYTIMNFIDSHNHNQKNLLPLVAVLKGNDIIDPGDYKREFAAIEGYQEITERFNIRVTEILLLLEQQLKNGKDPETLILSRCYSIKKKMAIKDCIKNYKEPRFTGQSELSKCFEERDLPQPPDWFIQNLPSSKVSAFLLNIVTSRKVFLRCQMEDMDRLSAQYVSHEIRNAMYAILLNRKPQLSSSAKRTLTDEDETKNHPSGSSHPEKDEPQSLSSDITRPTENCPQVTEYDRDGVVLKEYFVNMCNVSSFHGHYLPSLDEIDSLRCEETFELIKHVLCPNFKTNNKYPLSHDLETIVCLVVFWVNKASPPIGENHLVSVLVGLLFMYCIRFEEEEEIHIEEFTRTFKDSSKRQRKSYARNLNGYAKGSSSLDVKIVHGFSQYQSCLFAMIHFNKLLQTPCTFLDARTFYNGTFLYNFYLALVDNCSSKSSFIHEMLVKHSPMSALYDTIFESVRHQCGEGGDYLFGTYPDSSHSEASETEERGGSTKKKVHSKRKQKSKGRRYKKNIVVVYRK